MGIEYKLEKNQLKGSPKETITDMSMHGFGDCVSFRKKNEDGSTFGSDWGLGNIGCFRELKSYKRLQDMPEQDINKLAARIYELLYMNSYGPERYYKEPKIDETQPEYKRIAQELTTLQETQKELVASGKLVFPSISKEELACKDQW